MDAMPFMPAHWLCQFVQTSAVVLFAGAAALRLLARGTGAERLSSWTMLAWWSWGISFGAAVLQLGLTAADMSGLPLAQACTGPLLATVLGSTTYGTVWEIRMCLLAGVLFIETWRVVERRRVGVTHQLPNLDMGGALLAAALLTTLVLSGHAHASDNHAWLLPTDLLHVIAAGAWPGGLLPITLLLIRARSNPDLVSPAITITRRFSQMSVVAVGLLVMSGLFNSIGLVGTLSALFLSTYGRLIVFKVILLGGMIGLGAVNRRLIQRASAPLTLRSLCRNVALEFALTVGVLLATEALAMHAPPASQAGVMPMPFYRRVLS